PSSPILQWPRAPARSRPVRRAVPIASPSTTSCCESKSVWAPKRSSPAGTPSEGWAYEEAGAHPARRERLEPEESLYWLDRCRPFRKGPTGGARRRAGTEAGRLHVRRSLYVRAQTRYSHLVDRARRAGPDVDSGAPLLAFERAPLWRAARV